ncbi:TrmB family transcriptional regulator [Halorussus ruber]|uniref:TrmB family transcriptional regulator n=1 Tax=Halorussus ruber TaxID=1126238 RepID=UPI0010928A3F|nr:helix-turn-helix domain-containing protein [Halorussus ruber]
MASLRDLGLSEYEARAYRSLLDAGPTTAKELSRASDVPMGRIYDVLSSLETHNLARSQSASRPKKYVAVEPETALNRLLDDKLEELEEQADQYEAIVEDLTDELDAGDPVEEGFWTAAVGPEDSTDLLVERLDAADDQIVMVAGGSTAQFDIGDVGDLVAEHLEAALDRGVEVSLLLSPEVVDTLPPSVGERYAETFADHPEFAVRTAEGLRGTFNLIDDVEVCIEVANPLNPDEAFAMIDMKDPEFAAGVRETFAPRWEAAEPLSFGG